MAVVTLAHRFPAGAAVQLWRTRDVRVLHPGPASAELVDTRIVPEGGILRFDAGVQEGAHYLAAGTDAGRPLVVRARGVHEDAEPTEIQDPAMPDRRWKAAAPGHGPTLESEGRRLRQEDVNGVPQASDTPTGTATPI
jgi:hypothetical protein